MRDQFVADVGDFGKYGLLRALSQADGSGENLRLGVVWYFVADRMTRYLDKRDRFQSCDPELFRTLGKVIENCQRKVTAIEEGNALPKRTIFYRQPVPPQLEERRAWRQWALRETKGCELVFLDPDNGITDTPNTAKLSAKHVYYADIEAFLHDERSLVVYHHLGRVSHDAEIRAQASRLRDSLPFGNTLWALKWRPYSPRAYFIWPNGRDARLQPRIEALLKRPWRRHFEPILFP